MWPSMITRASRTSRSRRPGGPTCAAFLERRCVVCRAAHHHPPRDQRQRQRLRVPGLSGAARPGPAHLRTRPYTPRTNGKAERFIQTLLREWAYVEPYRTSRDRRRALRPWLRYYNRQRPHASLNYQPPSSRLRGAA